MAVNSFFIGGFSKMNKSSLNEAIYKMITLPDNAKIADLGCRDAAYLNGFIEEFPNKIVKAVGVDVTDKGFNNISYTSPVELKVMNCGKKLDFPDNEFDLVVAKDLLECIKDKESFVREICRILKPGGAVICVNCDFDSVVYNGKNKALITKAVHAYAATKQPWMDDFDSWMGRRTFSVFNDSGCFKSEIKVHSVVETEYKEGKFGYDFSRHIGWLSNDRTGAITADEYEEFINDLKEANKNGTYIFSKPYYIYKGIKVK